MPSTTASRAATTCSRSRWRWIPFPGTRSRAGSAGTATSGWRPTARWEAGYGDFRLARALATLRRIPWLEATALVLCGVLWHDGSPVAPSPRQVLAAQVARAREAGFEPMFGTELE